MNFSETQVNVYVARCKKVISDENSSNLEVLVAEMILERIKETLERKAAYLHQSQG